MIEFHGISKSFGQRKILDKLSFEVKEGEKLFVLGRSGTGKSVMLKLLIGLLTPDEGRIRVGEHQLPTEDESKLSVLRRNCSLVFQLPTLIDSRSLFENMTLGIRALPLAEQIARTKEALELVGLASVFEKAFKIFPPQLSYGEQKRISLARTLAVRPSVLLYDEPTTGMDPLTSRRIHELITTVGKGKTSLVVSHDMRNALKTADRILLVEAGKIQDQGSPDDLRRSQHPLTREFLKDLADV